jgi:hypothetical protein
MLRDLLVLEGWRIGRKHIATLMRRMGNRGHLSQEEHQPASSRACGLSVPVASAHDRAAQPSLGRR